jgi:hypothetical protein
MAEPEPKMGANELLPIRTRHPKHGRYEMKADLSEIIWSVAPVSATRRLVWGRWASEKVLIECDGGLLRRAVTFLGRQIVVTPLGSPATREELALYWWKLELGDHRRKSRTRNGNMMAKLASKEDCSC